MEMNPDVNGPSRIPVREEILLAAHDLGDGKFQSWFLINDANCGGCIRTIENGVKDITGILEPRSNLSTRRLSTKWKREDIEPIVLFQALAALGYDAYI
jgi:Cu2+-exporting ATPase